MLAHSFSGYWFASRCIATNLKHEHMPQCRSNKIPVAPKIAPVTVPATKMSAALLSARAMLLTCCTAQKVPARAPNLRPPLHIPGVFSVTKQKHLDCDAMQMIEEHLVALDGFCMTCALCQHVGLIAIHAYTLFCCELLSCDMRFQAGKICTMLRLSK